VIQRCNSCHEFRDDVGYVIAAGLFTNPLPVSITPP